MYTQCPSCRTVFRTGPAQLAAAQGSVRCGRCQHVFDARRHLYARLLDIPSASEVPAVGAQRRGAEEESRDKGLSAPSIDHNPAAPGPTPPPARPGELPFSAETRGPETAPGITRADLSLDAIEAEGLEDLPRISSTEAATKPSSPRRSRREAPTASTTSEAAPPKPQAVTDPGNATARSTHPQGAKSAPTFAARDAPEDFTVSLDEEDLDAGPALKADARAAPRPGMKSGMPAERRPSARATAGWAFAILSLLALLVFQYVYFMRDDLARYPQLRPWLEKLCAEMGCELSALRDLDAFEITYREVHSHPKAKDALLINATFVNKAPFTQPYPILQISLSDASGHMVALRRLQPAEYLGEGMDVKQGIPPQAPVHVVLEVLDPGRNAVGFQFDFL